MKKADKEKGARKQAQLSGREMFDPKDFQCREFYSMNELVGRLRRLVKVWSWGVSQWVNIDNHCLRMKVNGHHHKGCIFIVVNFSDLFDIYYTDFNGIVKFYDTDVYLDNLVDVIDKRIEYVPEYENR